MPPTRMLVKTKSAHATHSAADAHSVDATLRGHLRRQRTDGRQRGLVDVVERDSSIGRSERVRPRTSSGVRTPAPPMTAIFMAWPAW